MDAQTARTLRKLGNKVVRAYDDKKSYWWRIGQVAHTVKNDVDPSNPWERVREAIEMQGRICTKKNRSIQRIHRTFSYLSELEISYDNVRGVPLSYALNLVTHHKQKRITTEQLKALLKERQQYIGRKHPNIVFSWVRDKDKIPVIKQRLFDE